jgi:hypothetical protein
MYHLGEVRWRQGRHEEAAQLLRNSLEIIEGQVGSTTRVVFPTRVLTLDMVAAFGWSM